MKLSYLAAGALVLLVAPPAMAQRTIQLLATVTSPTNEPIGTVEASRVTLTEDGKPATITKVEAVQRTRKLHILVDSGIGFPPEALADLRTGLRNLVNGVPEGVQISVVATSPQPRMIERGTADRARALKAIDLIVPDSGAGRFVEALSELAQRIDRDKDSMNTVVMVGTMSGDIRVRPDDIKRTYAAAGSGRMRTFVVLYAGRGANTSLGGDAQIEVGQAVAQSSGGMFERINTTTRVISLLDEIGKTLSGQMGASATQLRIFADRPGGASGEFGKVSASIQGLLITGLNFEQAK